MVCVTAVAWNVCVTGEAGKYEALSGCEAVIEQVPAAASVTVLPETVHTVVVLEAKLTVRPDDAVAVIANGGVLAGR